MTDHARAVIRTELKTIDIQVVQDPAIPEPVSIRISDHLRAFCEQNFLIGSQLSNPCLEAVDELDRGQPQPSHFPRYVMAHVREIPILRSDQVGPVARGHIGLLLVSPLIADAGEDMSRIVIRSRRRRNPRIRDLRNAGLDCQGRHENKRQKAGADCGPITRTHC